MENSQAPFCYLFLLDNDALHAVFEVECSGRLDELNGSPSFLCEKPVKIMRQDPERKWGNKTSQKRSQRREALKSG